MSNEEENKLILEQAKIKLICEMPSSYKITFYYNISQISCYEDLIFELYEYLSTLEVNKLSIFLGHLYFVTKDLYDATSPNMIDQEKYESVNEITPENYKEDFLDILCGNIKNDNLDNSEFFLLFKLQEEILQEEDLEISNMIINLFLESYKLSGSEDKEISNLLKQKYEEINCFMDQKYSDINMDLTSPISFIKILLDRKSEKLL